jgi:hypothetical protein
MSVKDLEELLCGAESRHRMSENEKEVYGDILLERWGRLNKEFTWTEENIKKFCALSDNFCEAWEKGLAKAKELIDIHYEHAANKAGFWDDHTFEIVLTPFILEKKPDTGEIDITSDPVLESILSHFDANVWLVDHITESDYNPVTRDDSAHRKDNIHFSRELSWNIEGLGDEELANHYICYSLHELYSHQDWALQDIAKINYIEVEVIVTHSVSKRRNDKWECGDVQNADIRR